MKAIVLYGASDRYNYGDNLMPILFEMFVTKYAPYILDDYVFIYASIADSDLSRYGCRPTASINSVMRALPRGSAVIVTGGQVLRAKNAALFLHMQSGRLMNLVYRLVRRLLPRVYSQIVKHEYSTQWEFPYLPDVKAFPEGTRFIYNAVGGTLNGLSERDLRVVEARAQAADYFSVRDVAAREDIGKVRDVILVPDSAYLMSDLLDTEYLDARIRAEIRSRIPTSYFTFQAAPHKVGCDFQKLLKQVEALVENTGGKVVLLPIGYASGHDDVYLLRRMQKRIGARAILLHELNMWEIMYIIKSSKFFFGTSLHGIITAMSFNLPHFGINPRISKLDAFLRAWSVFPYNRCYGAEKLSELPAMITRESLEDLRRESQVNKERVKSNNLEILRTLLRS